jgi:dTDP-4-dehydrorhamnose reductase
MIDNQPIRVLILGANGQLGQELRDLAPLSIGLRSCDRKNVDIQHIDQVVETAIYHQPHYIINVAAYTNVDRAESDSDNAYAINCGGALNCAIAAKVVGAKLIHVSTDYVFGGQYHHNIPFLPTDPVCPINVYGASKAKGEQKVQLVLEDNALILRTSWVYSPYGNNFVKTIIRLLKEQTELRIVGDQYGTPTYAAFLAAAIWRSLDLPITGIHHYTDSGNTTWYNFAVAIQEEALSLGITHKEIPIIKVTSADLPWIAPRPNYSVLDKTTGYDILGKAFNWRVTLHYMMVRYAAMLKAGVKNDNL